MRSIVIAALAVAFITAVVSSAEAHGPSQFRSVRRAPFFSFQIGGRRDDFRRREELRRLERLQDLREAELRAELRRQERLRELRFQQQFRGHHN